MVFNDLIFRLQLISKVRLDFTVMFILNSESSKRSISFTITLIFIIFSRNTLLGYNSGLKDTVRH